MTSAGDQVLRETIRDFLAEIDGELKRSRGDDPYAHVERIKQKMIAPPFTSAATAVAGYPPPLVSVVLPTRNRGSVIRDAIESVQVQSFTNWELIIIDDGSHDNTPDVVAALSADRRIRYVVQAFSGQAHARNHALRLSRGSLVAYIDSDNLWYPNFLDACVAMLASFGEVDCVYGGLLSYHHREPPHIILFDDFDWNRLLLGNYIDLNAVVHRKTLTDTYGGFDEKIDRLVDWDLLLRLTHHKPPGRVPVLAALYRVVDAQRVSDTRPYEPNYAAIQRKWPAGSSSGKVGQRPTSP